jgi:hypothetical protein
MPSTQLSLGMTLMYNDNQGVERILHLDIIPSEAAHEKRTKTPTTFLSR